MDEENKDWTFEDEIDKEFAYSYLYFQATLNNIRAFGISNNEMNKQEAIDRSIVEVHNMIRELFELKDRITEIVRKIEEG